MAANIEVQRNKVLDKIKSFCSKTLSSSDEKANTSAAAIVRLKNLGHAEILARGGMMLVPPLNDAQWSDFRERITKRYDNSSTEVKGIHPPVRQIFTACNLLGNAGYAIEFETRYHDMDAVVKRPDISVVMHLSVGIDLERIVIPVEIKKFKNLRAALYQALGYLVNKLRNLLDKYGWNVALSGFCLATDGLNLAVGYALIQNSQLVVKGTCCKIPLWTDRLTKPLTETLGVRIIRTFLNAAPHLLGHNVHPNPTFTRNSADYELKHVIGRGAFCSAFHTTVTTGGGEQSVVVKKTALDSTITHNVPLARLQAECEVLRSFTENLTPQCPNLPILYDALWTVTPEFPMIPMSSCGIPLEYRVLVLSKADRDAETIALHLDLVAAMHAAHNLGFCHRDVRPENIVYDSVSNEYILIDWGLAAAPGALMHEYDGGYLYWHDHLVNSELADTDMTTVPYQVEHDLVSARYVAWAFSKGKKMKVEWSGRDVDLVAFRADLLHNFLT